MDIEDLKPGDVLVFSGEKGSFISEAIMLLTGAPVSHSAIAYKVPRQIVEETMPAVRVVAAADRFTGRTIYVNRLNPQPQSMEPVLDAAAEYLNAEEPFAMSNLFLVGLLLLYKRFTPNTETKKVMIKILKILTRSLIDYINKLKTPGKLPMVCSQFVYQCYEDAGTNYRLKLRGPVLAMALRRTPSPVSTLDRVIRRLRSTRSPAFRGKLLSAAAPSVARIPVQTEEELMRELVDALGTTEKGAAEEPEDELALAVSQFGQAAYAVSTDVKLGRGMALRAGPFGVLSDALNFLKAEEAYFVTPADLLDRCANLSRAGTIPAQ